jgi:hypothetical protein
MPSANRLVSLFAIIWAIVVTVILAAGSYQPIEPLPPKPSLPQALAEASSRTPLGMAVNWALAIRAKQPRPEAVVWQQILASKDGSVVCLDYWSRSSTGDKREQVAFVVASGQLSVMPWEAACLRDVSPITDVQKWLPASSDEVPTRM